MTRKIKWIKRNKCFKFPSIYVFIQTSIDGSTGSGPNQNNECVNPSASREVNSGKDYGGLDFKIIWDYKTGPSITIHLVAPTMQEKAAWISDISQVSKYFFFF